MAKEAIAVQHDPLAAILFLIGDTNSRSLERFISPLGDRRIWGIVLSTSSMVTQTLDLSASSGRGVRGRKIPDS
jgi:hypothetical protein